MDIKTKISTALQNHIKKDIHKLDVLYGDELIADILDEHKNDIDELTQLSNYFSHEIASYLTSEYKQVEVINNDYIDKEINKIINNIDNDFVKQELIRLNNAPKKKFRARLMSNVLSEDNYFYLAYIELLHLASLIQDDVIDDANMRRFITTTNYLYDNRTAILVSDYLLMYLMKFLQENYLDEQIDRELQKYYNKHYQLFKQMIKSEKTGRVTTLSKYYEYIEGKTSNLFAVALANSYALENREQIDQNVYQIYFNFGVEFGNIFQIIDDFKDYYGEEEDSGKTKIDHLTNSPNYCKIINTSKEQVLKNINQMFVNLKKIEIAGYFKEEIDYLEEILYKI